MEERQVTLVDSLARAGHHRSRGRGGAHPSRILSVRNVETPSGSGITPGCPTVRKDQFPGGNRMAQEANGDRPKGQGKADGARLRITRRIRVRVTRPERAPTWAR